MTDNNEEKAFEELAGRAGHIVGAAEEEARQIVGDEQFEYLKYINRLADTNNMALVEANTALQKAQSRYRDSLTQLVGSFRGLLSVGILLAIGWSIFAWCK